MKKKWFWIPAAILTVAVIALVLWLTVFAPHNAPEPTPSPSDTTTTTTTAPAEDVVTPGHLSFTGKVLEVNDGMALMECYDKDKFDTVLVNYAQVPSLTPQVGEEYTVTYEDMVMPSLPPRIVAVEMTLVSSTPTHN